MGTPDHTETVSDGHNPHAPTGMSSDAGTTSAGVPSTAPAVPATIGAQPTTAQVPLRENLHGRHADSREIGAAERTDRLSGRVDPGTASVAGPADEPRLQPCCQAMAPEHFTDWCPLVTKCTDRWGDRYVSALGDRRQHAVACCDCRQSTWALDARCDRCAIRQMTRALTHLDADARKALLS